MTQTATGEQQLSREERMKIQMGKPIAEDQSPWYALQLFTLKQLDIAEMLGEKGLEFFIPLHYVDYEDKSGRRRSKLKPVVTNLIFVKKTFECCFERRRESLSTCILFWPESYVLARISR